MICRRRPPARSSGSSCARPGDGGLGPGRLEAGGKRLDYACWGPPPGEAPTLVLLHEGLGCVDLWRGVPERLAAATGFGVAAYSRAGYGRSDPADLPRPLDYMTGEAVEVLPQVLDALAVRDLVLIGHSDGATIAPNMPGGWPTTGSAGWF